MKKTAKRLMRRSNLYSKINRILVFLFILFLPTQLGRHFFLPFSYLSGVRVDYLAPTIYVTDVIVFFLALINIRPIFSVFRQKSLLLILILFIPNVIFARSFPVALYQYMKIIEVIIVGILAYQQIIKERKLYIAFLIAGLFQFLLAILQLSTKHSLQGVFYFFGERYLTLSLPGIAKAALNGVELLRPYGTFSHPNSLAGFFLLIYIWTLTNKKNASLFLKYFILFVSICLILISFSKAAIITLILLTITYLSLSTKKCRFCFFARIIILATVGLLFLQASTDPLSLQKRLELMNNSFKIILQQPFIGTGIGNYLIAQNQFSSKFSYFFNQPVHNIFLLFFAESGLILGGFIFILFVRFLKKWFDSRYLFIIGAIIMTGLIDHYWLTLQQNLLLAGFLIGMSLKRRIKASQEIS